MADARTANQQTSEIRTPGFCALCKSRCGAIMVTRDGRLIGQEPDPSHPTGQALCVKGKAAPELVYNTQRLLHPVRRTRPRGDPDPGWERISWDEALEHSAREMARIRDQHGAEAVAFGWTTPSGTPIADDLRWIERLANAFGTPNVANGTEICNWHKDFAHAFTFGRGIASPDFEHTGCVVLWGHNPSATWLDHATATTAAKARGAKLIVVDPRQVGFAGRADQWLRVRPGADGALALGIAGEMLRNGWFDSDFVRDRTNASLLVRSDTGRFLRANELASLPSEAEDGDLVAVDGQTGQLLTYSPSRRTFAPGCSPEIYADLEVMIAGGAGVRCQSVLTLYRALCEDYPPERVEQLAWIPSAQIRETAKLIFASRPVCYYAWSGVGQHTNATQTDRAIAILMALTGSFDAPGGNVEFSKPAARDVSGQDLISAEQRSKCIGFSRSAVGPAKRGWIGSDLLYDAILDGKPYPIRGLVGFGRNFLVNHADAQRGAAALQKLEFYLHTDVVLTPTAAYADIVLPINTPWEREALRVSFEGNQRAHNHVQLRQAAIRSEGESRSDAFVVFELAKRLGLGDVFWDGEIEEGLKAILAPLGIDPQQLREQPSGVTLDGAPMYGRYKRDGFKTPTGLIEIFSEALLEAGQSPLPDFVEPALSPHRPGGEAFPLVLTSAKVVQYCHGQHRHVPSLRRRVPDPEVTLHPDAAGERGISEGEWVEIRTDRGSARMRAKLDASLDPRVVSAQYGWWQANDVLGLPSFGALDPLGPNYNRLISDRHADPVSGATGLRSSICEIVPLKSEPSLAWSGWRPFEMTAGEMEAEDILSLHLRPADEPALPTFHGGQHIVLRLPLPEGGTLVRCYSLSGPSGDGTYRISVKLARGATGTRGLMSAALHGLKGKAPVRVALRAPKGDFILHRPTMPSGSIVLVAGGIGVTPLLAMLHQLRAGREEAPIRFLYGVRSPDELAFASEIKAIAADLPRLSVQIFQSGEALPPSASGFAFKAGRISPSDVLEATSGGSQFHICGPSGLVTAITDALAKAGVADSHVHFETFGPSARSARPSAPQQVRLGRSGRVLTWTPESGSLLDLLKDAGVQSASGCRSGQCEACAIRLDVGEVDYPASVTKPDGDHCLPCVAMPVSSITLDV
ncbi:molybdopterin-dependent oxidoreductase [Azorhizobium oxalatiphilum]|nr:molybdopterin-dependent oxidoreductase [Azorhizobium oxalatiphilum]